MFRFLRQFDAISRGVNLKNILIEIIAFLHKIWINF